MTTLQQKSATEQAAYWVGTLKAGTMEEQLAFAAWLRASPQHLREFLVLTALDKELDEVDLTDLDIDKLLAHVASNVLPLSHSSEVGSERPAVLTYRLTGSLRAIAVGAGVAIVALVGTFLIADFSDSTDFTTVVGEERIFELSDGSVVRLNPLSRMEVKYSDTARDVRLLAGEAMFRVRRDSYRPFRVNSGSAIIQAVGTQFQVHKRSSGTVVSVIEGVVEISSARSWFALSDSSGGTTSASPLNTNVELLHKPARIAAGQGVRIAANGKAMTRQTFDPAQPIAWPERHLIFSGDTLADIAEDFNRYNRVPRIRVVGKSLRARLYSGAFDADDPESLVEYLREEEGIVVEHVEDELVIRMK